MLGLLDIIGRCMWPAGYLRLFGRGIAGRRAARLYLLRVLFASASVAQDVGQNKLHERFSFQVCTFVFSVGTMDDTAVSGGINKMLMSGKQQHSCMSSHSANAAPPSSASKQVHNRMHACQVLTANVKSSLQI